MRATPLMMLLLVPALAHAQPPTGPTDPIAPTEPTGPTTNEAAEPEVERAYAVYYLCGADDPRCASEEAQRCNASLAELRTTLTTLHGSDTDGLFEPDGIREGVPTLSADGLVVDGTGQHDLLRDPCETLDLFRDDLGWTLVLALDRPELWEPLAPDTETSVGSGAQASAVGAVVPTANFGATANYANANGLNYLVVAASVNPLGLLLSEPWASRLLDVSAVVPVLLGADMTIAGVSSGGVRLRSDIVGALRAALSAGEDRSDRLAREVSALGSTYADVADQLTPECWEDLVSGSTDACTALGPVVLERARALADALGARRRDLDLGYGGLDIRYDHGDPELVGTLPAGSNSLLLAAAGGFRLEFANPNLLFGARARLGYRLVEISGATRHQVEYGAAFELGFIIERRAVRASVGLDGLQTRDDTAPDPQVDQGTLRVGLSVPFTDSFSVSLGILYPFGDGATNQVAVVTGFSGAVPSL